MSVTAGGRSGPTRDQPVMDVDTFLGSQRVSENGWTFSLPRELHGAFGGAFGGIVGACALRVARSVSDGRTPIALDCRFLRGLPAGTASAVGTVLHQGRSLSTVVVDITTEDGRPATRATVSLVDPSSLTHVVRPSHAPPDGLSAFDDARPWPAVAPIVATLAARSVGLGDWGVASATRVPWDDADASAEAACLPGDLCVGPPVAMSMSGESVTHPNPDLSMRFCGDVTTDVVVGVGRTVRADGGVASVSIEVYSADDLVAIGISTSLLLGT